MGIILGLTQLLPVCIQHRLFQLRLACIGDRIEKIGVFLYPILTCIGFLGAGDKQPLASVHHPQVLDNIPAIQRNGGNSLDAAAIDQPVDFSLDFQ